MFGSSPQKNRIIKNDDFANFQVNPDIDKFNWNFFIPPSNDIA